VVQYIGVKEPAAAICKGVLNCKLESKLKATISGLSRKFLKPFILGNFSFSVYQNETFNTQNVCYNGRVFLCKMDRMKIKRMNQLEIAQNEFGPHKKFPLYGTKGE